MDLPDQARSVPGRLLVLYGRLLGPLIAGYLLFDKAFGYLHLPGTPLYVGELVLAVGVLGALAAGEYLRASIRDEPILVLLAVFMLWGLIRFLPEVSTYGIDAVRDSALWYYCLFAFVVCAALARSPNLLERLGVQLGRLTPWLLLWLPLGLVLGPRLAASVPNVPGTTVSILAHKTGNAAVAALLVLGYMWLFRDARSPASRRAWSIMAVVVIALAATQNRGGLLGVAAGAMVGLMFVRDRLRLIMRAVVIVALGLGIAALLAPKLSFVGSQGRQFSASQLVDNVMSLGGEDSPGNLGGTVGGREQLWSLVFDKQVSEDHLLDGSGFGPNLAAEVGVLDAGQETLRSPHNSHLDILARMGLVGFFLWIALWLGWYRRLIAGCRRLARQRLYARRQIAILSLTVTTAILVSTFFDPQLEGAQVAALLWTIFGVGVAVTSSRTWSGDGNCTSVSRRPGMLAP